jgi:hypothetical protein
MLPALTENAFMNARRLTAARSALVSMSIALALFLPGCCNYFNKNVDALSKYGGVTVEDDCAMIDFMYRDPPLTDELFAEAFPYLKGYKVQRLFLRGHPVSDRSVPCCSSSTD